MTEAELQRAICDHLRLRAHESHSFALELKSPGGRLSEAQLEFLARFNDAGGHSACAEGLDRAIAVLESWHLLRGRTS
jgi:hypothetical protein